MIYKTGLKKFYGIVPQEMSMLNDFFSEYKQTLNAEGFQEIKSPLIYSKESYLEAVKIHPHNMIYAVDFRNDSRYVIQSDAIMGICKIVSCLPDKHLLKLYQMGEMIRDNVKDSSDYMRKDFFQFVSGVWGSKSWYYDAELININLHSLKKNKQISPKYIMLSNFHIFDCIESGLSENIRFNGIQSVKNSSIDFEILKKNFHNYIFHDQFLEILDSITDPAIKNEMAKLVEISKHLKMIGCKSPIVYSLKNLHGTGYYSDVTYQIYGEINGRKNILLADGGRIDHMMETLSGGKNIPACCMGIGAQYLLQHFTEEKETNRIVILSDEKNCSVAFTIKECIKNQLTNKYLSLFLLERKKWQIVFKDFHYTNDTFILLKDDLTYEIRNTSEEKAKELEKIIRTLHIG